MAAKASKTMDLNKIEISIAQDADMDAIIRIMNQAIGEERNAYLSRFSNATGARWFSALKAGASALLVASRGGEVVGWGSLSAYRQGRGALGTVKEITFYVDQKARRLGVAGVLVTNLEAQAMRLGALHMVAILLDDNAPSKALLKKFGYEQWAHFPNIVHFPSHTAGHLYMGKHLR